MRSPLAPIAPIALILAGSLALGCSANDPAGLARSAPSDVQVRMDFEARPLPEIPLPNDLATRYDADSPTGRRLNASQVAPTEFERRTRRLVDSLDGWGLFAPITIPFTAAIDLRALQARHVGDDYELSDDAIYLVDVTEGSPEFGKARALDLGGGAFPVVLEELDGYWEGDPRGDTIALQFEEHDEDVNGNGRLDPGEDVDLDGLLDKPNYFPDVPGDLTGKSLAERSDALVSFYERETNTLIVRPLLPLREQTTYAVVVTRRVLDESGSPVGSPFEFVNHSGQTETLAPVAELLAQAPPEFGGLTVDEIAFAWTFSTGTVFQDFVVLRDGLYGHGIQRHLAAQFPADVSRLHPMFAEGATGRLKPRPYENEFAMSSERFIDILEQLEDEGVVTNGEGEVGRLLLDGLKYVDIHALGDFVTPRLIPGANDPAQNTLGWNEMVWPPDPSVQPVDAQPEDVTFWLTLPRREVSARGQGKPAPLMILGHGYGSSKAEVAGFHGFFSRHGLAVLAIDNFTHGLGSSADEKVTIEAVAGGLGLSGFARALLTDRSWDQDVDGDADSGADFWSAYAFHTRDVVRQTALDYLQLVRIVRSWDGVKTWPIDINGNGVADDIAGDFDGDGIVDTGGPDGEISMLGGSLGGIMSAVVGGIEPQLTSIVPVAGGGGLTDVGTRSIQGGVRESLQLRMMGPLYVGFPSPETGETVVRAIVPSLNDDAKIEVARVPATVMDRLAGGGAVVYGENLDNGEYDCARLLPDAQCVAACAGDGRCESGCHWFRLALGSDMSLDVEGRQRHRLTFYDRDVFIPGARDGDGSRGCERKPDADRHVAHVIDQFGNDVDFHFRAQALHFAQGDTLSPLAEGLGMHRARPSIRRFVGFAQMILDPADPAVYATRWQSDEQRYATGEVVQTRSLVLNTVGDMNVPVAGGAAIGRAAGLLDYKTPIAEWGGRTVHQVVVDTFVLEAVDTNKRFVDSADSGVLFDPENLSGSVAASLPPVGVKVELPTAAPGVDGWEVPRLDPPLHTHAVGPDALGGQSGTVFPFVIPRGKHGFLPPGEDRDRLRGRCDAAALALDDEADRAAALQVCGDNVYFDHALAIIGMAGRYLASGGTDFSVRECDWNGRCPDVAPPPDSRD